MFYILDKEIIKIVNFLMFLNESQHILNTMLCLAYIIYYNLFQNLRPVLFLKNQCNS